MSIVRSRVVLGGLLAVAMCGGGAACGEVKSMGPDGGTGGGESDGGGGGSSDARGGQDPAFLLSVPANPVDIRLAGSAEVEVTVERTGGFQGDVSVNVTGLPEGVSADSISIPAGEISRTLTIDVAQSADAGQAYSLGVEGRAGELEESTELGIFLIGISGTMDESYGSGGLKLLSLPNGAGVRSMVRQPDGKLVLGGRAGDAMIVVRVNEDGSLDPGFGTGGVATLDFSSVGVPDVGSVSVALQSDGKIVAASYGDADPDPDVVKHNGVLARLDPSGAPDGTFAGGGKVAYAMGSASTTASHMVTTDDDRIIVAGWISGTDDTDWFLARFTADGAADSSFDGDGFRSDDGGHPERGRQVVVRPDGSLVVRGSHQDLFQFKDVLLSYQSSGDPDAGFGTGGQAVLEAVGNELPRVNQLLPRADGSLLGAGSLQPSGSAEHRPVIYRFTAGGELDTSWSGDGYAEIPPQSDEEVGRFSGVVETADGAVAFGLTGPSVFAGDTLMLARFLNNGTLDPDFGASGVQRHPLGSGSAALRGFVEVEHSRLLVLIQSDNADGDTQHHLARVWL